MTRYTKMLLRLLATILLACLPLISHAQSKIAHQKLSLPQDQYMIGLMKLALSHVDKPYNFQEQDKDITRSRIETLVLSDELSVMWTGASKQLHERYRAIEIPAYKGLMGHRIFIIRKGDQARFDSVTSVTDLQRIKMGQGRTWTDTDILKNGGMEVVTALKFDGLMYMLDGGRFDAFPRGVQEPWSEIDSHADLPLTVEKGIVLKYLMPYYFYISPKREQLALDLEAGLEAIIANGKFDDYFFKDPIVKSALELSQLKDRRIYTIDNPNLPNTVPIARPELWLDISQIK